MLYLYEVYRDIIVKSKRQFTGYISHCLSDVRTTLNPIGSPLQDYLPYLPCSTSNSVADNIYIKNRFCLFQEINLKPPNLNN